MNDIEILEDMRDNIYGAMQFEDDYQVTELEEKQFNALNLAIKSINRVKELEEYSNWHIEHLTGDIEDFIDDDRKGNAGLIGELKEEREHWKDIKRIIKNEKTYIDYKNY